MPHMNEKNILKLNQIFITVLQLDEDTDLDNHDLQNDERWDSLAQVLLIAAIESEFSISIDASEYENFISYSAVKNLLVDYELWVESYQNMVSTIKNNLSFLDAAKILREIEHKEIKNLKLLTSFNTKPLEIYLEAYARTKFIDALGEAPNEIKSTSFDRLNSWGLLVAKTIFKIYSEIFESI